MKNPLNFTQFGWHTRRAIGQVVRSIRDSVVRRGTKASKYYEGVSVNLVAEKYQKTQFRLAHRVANAIENGHRAYNWGMKVLQNNKGGKNKYDKTGSPYRHVVMKGADDDGQVLTVSEKSIRNSGFTKWRMPMTKGAGLMKKQFYSQKETYRKVIKEAVKKDLILDRQRKKRY